VISRIANFEKSEDLDISDLTGYFRFGNLGQVSGVHQGVGAWVVASQKHMGDQPPTVN
jgi:hypothetical protein